MASKILKKPDSFFESFSRRSGPDKVSTHYCPGCGHGVLHKLIAEAADDLGIQDRCVFINPVGCSVFAYFYLDFGNIQVAHGRAPAVATAVKRVHPHAIVISYQGDGDLAAIGGNNILQAANRGENITVFFVNNAIYGMTGGQLAPTSLIGQRTATTPRGRSAENDGYPMRVCELLATLEGPTYIERTSLRTPKLTQKTRKAIRKALQYQMENRGFSLVEILSPCPTGWKVDPVKSLDWMEQQLEAYFQLGVFKDVGDERPAKADPERDLWSANYGTAIDLPTDLDAKLPEASPAPKYRNPSLKIAGFGGQGVLLLGYTLAEAGMLSGYHVTWIPSYGPEMRGGTANCQVGISEERIGSPIVSNPSVLIATNLPSMDRFEPEIREGGLLLYDRSLIDRKPNRTDIESIAIPATSVADELGNSRAANMVMLGAYIGKTGLLSRESVMEALDLVIKRKNLIDLNIKAIDKGIEYGRGAR
ncbi:MAG: 2-oxoacid:acceptor oxidoreductase family protein [Candidatus Eisenbacteria sp.]|nr:2-oxoacid:acceptor oxidoreductase family protein [Candidatus Eisenbacteria bacterium]